MAIYRNIQMSFWTDTKIMDEFSANEKLMYLYLLTNPHTNLCGCYEISFRQMSYETGLDKSKVEDIVMSLQSKHNVIRYCKETKEVLLLNWSKYNWTASEKFRKPLLKEIENIKNIDFKAFLGDLESGSDTVSIPYEYGSDTTVTVTVTDTVTVADTDKEPVPAIQCKQIEELFHSTCKSLPRIRSLNNQRKAHIRNLLKTYTVDDFQTVFAKAEASDFLSGRTGKWSGCCFDWLIKPSNFLKVLEGNYDNAMKKQNTKFNNSTERTYDMDELERKLLGIV